MPYEDLQVFLVCESDNGGSLEDKVILGRVHGAVGALLNGGLLRVHKGFFPHPCVFFLPIPERRDAKE